MHINYRASLEEKLKTLDALWLASGNDLGELQSFLHKLAGSAGMYGFDQISAQCIQLQTTLKTSESLEMSQKEYRRLSALIEENLSTTPPDNLTRNA